MSRRLFLVLMVLSISSTVEAKKILLIGDSQAQGLLPHLRELCAADGNEFFGFPHAGWNTQRFLDNGFYVPDDVDLAVVVLGGNNREFNLEVYRDRVTALIHVLQEKGIPQVLWLGPAHAVSQPYGRYHDRTAEIQQQVFAFPQEYVKWVDSRGDTISLPHRSDGVHFQRTGYQVWAVTVYNYMQPLLKE